MSHKLFLSYPPLTISLSYVSTQTGRFKLGFQKQPSLNVICTEKLYFDSFRNTKREEMCFLFSKNQKKDFDHHHLSSDGFTSNPNDFKLHLKRDLSLIPIF